MKFMILVKATPETEAGVMPSDALLEAMGRYNEQLVNAGVMRDGNGLQPSSKGSRIRFAGGDIIVTDGPFAETTELLAGYTLIETATREEAIAWVKRWPAMDADFELELRQVFTLEDFAPGKGLAVHEALARRLALQPDKAAVHLGFSGNCREAFAFYAECLGGQVTFQMSYGESPAAAEVPPEMHDMLVHAELNLGKLVLMGADAPADQAAAAQGFTVQLEINDPERAEQVFTQLAEGGRIIMPFEETFWALRFGMAMDRFGIPWMINCGRK